MRLVIILTMLISGCIHAAKTNIRDTAVTNLPVTYTDGDAISITGIRGKGWSVVNDTMTAVYVCFTDDTDATGCVDAHYIPASSFIFRDNYALTEKIFVRGASVISSGVVEVTVNSNN